MIKLKNIVAFKTKCYWLHTVTGWELADHKGAVYKDKYGLWLETPTGYTRVSLKDLLNVDKRLSLPYNTLVN